MQINNKQDLFYSLTLTPGSQEYFVLPIPADASGFRIVVNEIVTDIGTLAKTDPAWGIISPGSEAGGWEKLFEQLRIEDATRTTNDVVCDLRYSADATSNDMAYMLEACTLASPLPTETYAIRSAAHMDITTGPMGASRFFVKTSAAAVFNGVIDLAAIAGSASVTSITIGFVALIGPAIPKQSIRVYHIGEESDKTIEYIYPTGNSPRSTLFTQAAFSLDDIYSNGNHLTSTPSTMITDYNVFRQIDGENSTGLTTGLNNNAYLTVGSLAGQRIRYENSSAGRMHVVAIYTEA